MKFKNWMRRDRLLQSQRIALRKRGSHVRRLPCLPASRFRRHLQGAASASTDHTLAGDSRGSAIVIFALLLLPIVFSIGAIFDLSQAYAMREKLSYALRAAGRAFKADQTSSWKARQHAEAIFEQYRLTFPAGAVSDLEIVERGNAVMLSADVHTETPFLAHFGIDSVPITVSRRVDQYSGGGN